MNGRVYYNEIDPFAASWLRELIADGLIPAGDVDERSIVDVQPGDVRGYTACHWFAGIGGWALALQLAGWPADRPVWTGSCPCQPLSSAGRRQGDLDERHLWPAFHRLIFECCPPMVFGEQVASKDGREWFSAVRIDLEHLGYACGGADLCAAGVGAPHIRQRLFWCARDLADAAEPRWRAQPIGTAGADGRSTSELGRLRDPGAVDDSERVGRRARRDDYGRDVGVIPHAASEPCGLGDAGSQGRRQIGADVGGSGEGSRAQGLVERSMHQRACGMGNAEMHGARPGQQQNEPCRDRRPVDRRSGPWASLEWLPCRDGRSRPTKPGLLPLASGISNRVGTLRGAGNAIVAQLGAEFIQASIEALEMTEVAA